LLVETLRLGNEEESAITNVLEELMHVIVPLLCGPSDGVAVSHDRGESTSGKSFLDGRLVGVHRLSLALRVVATWHRSSPTVLP
jgi:hypothetical protein